MNRTHLSLLLLALAAPLQAEDLTPKVKALFEAKCKECHHPDTEDDFPYLHEGFDLAELIEEEMITKGNPDESAIFRRVSMDPTSKKRMPKSSGAEGDDSYKAPLTAEEQTLIRDWIAQTGDTAPAPAPASVVTATVEDKVGEFPANLDLNGKVHWIFANRCGQCHEGDYEPELHGGANLAAFFTERDDSGTILLAEAVLDRVGRDHADSERMPKSKGAAGDKGFRPPLTEAETAVLKEWVEAGKPEEVKRKFISQTEVLEAILDDLNAASETQRGFYRYLTLTNLHNQADAGGGALIPDLDPHRAAVGKLINSLSMNAKITVPEAIDAEGTIYRIDLRDYNWSAEQWEEVVSHYPYGIIGIDRQKENLIARHTGSPMAYLRADWFTFAASQPPLYDRILDELLGIDPTQEDVHTQLDEALGVDRFENLREGRAMRAGFQYSGVSGANRLIERHELGSHQGAYWVSYDFTPLSAERTHDLTLAPLGPVEAGLTDDHEHMFNHDGGEMIYHLPNGLQGYMLTTNKGVRLDRAPIEIVQDDNRQDKVILNGISCMACHDKGVKPPIKVTDLSKRTLATMEDEVRPLVEAAGILDFKESNLLRKLYPEPAVLQAAIKEDFERFTKAEMEATGGRSGAAEPVLGLYKEFRGAVTARKLAAEFGMEYDELLTLLKEESDSSEVLSVISSSMERDLSVRRENLLREYISVVYALGYELMPFVPLGYEEFGGQKYADLVANSDQFLAAFGSDGLSVAETKLAVSGSAGASEALASESVLMHGGGKLRLSIEPKLTVGERANLEIVATDDAHIRVFHLSSDQHVTELFPGSTNQDTFRPKNKKLVVSWETTAPGGPEHLVVYAAKTGLTNVAKGEVAGDFTIYEKDQIFSSRGIPKAVRAEEASAGAVIPAQVTEARIGYFLKD
jgi:mono/diheme cytochrome c family protein